MATKKEVTVKTKAAHKALKELGEVTKGIPQDERHAIASTLRTIMDQWPRLVAMVLLLASAFVAHAESVVYVEHSAKPFPWTEALVAAGAVYELLVRLVPTSVNLSIVGRILAILGTIVPNKVKGHPKERWFGPKRARLLD